MNTIHIPDSDISITVGSLINTEGIWETYEAGSGKEKYVYRKLRGDISDEKLCKRAENEIRILKKLQPLRCVPELIASGDDDSGFWYVTGRYLRLKSTGRFFDDISLLAKAVRALKTIHDCGVAVGNIRLKNIASDGENIIFSDMSSALDECSPELMSYPDMNSCLIPDEMAAVFESSLDASLDGLERGRAADVFMLAYAVFCFLIGDTHETAVFTDDLNKFEENIVRRYSIRRESNSVAVLFMVLSSVLNCRPGEKYSLDDFISGLEKAAGTDYSIDTQTLSEVIDVRKCQYISLAGPDLNCAVFDYVHNGKMIEKFLSVLLNRSLLVINGEFIPGCTIYNIEHPSVVTVSIQPRWQVTFAVKKLTVYSRSDYPLCRIDTRELPASGNQPDNSNFRFSPLSGIGNEEKRIYVFNPGDMESCRIGNTEIVMEKIRKAKIL